jgi:SagB-type dehydrogenase family enzyme
MPERSVDELLGVKSVADKLWEVFHENSKNWRAVLALSERSGTEIQTAMKRFHESLPYAGYPVVELPAPCSQFDASLTQAILARESVRRLTPRLVQLDELAAILHYSYGMLRDNTFVPFPPRTRAVASAGALYPLELYFDAARIAGLSPGLYHYSPKEHCLHRLRATDPALVPCATLYPDLVREASFSLFVTAVFERSTWKYGERGYRYALIEAGSVAQNVGLISAALGLGCFNLGGYVDREVDDLLGLDGVTQSTVHLLCVGGRGDDTAEP